MQSDEIDAIVRATVADYEASAESFWQGTRTHDVTQNYDALLRALPANVPLDILDLGCGPGRDLRWFADAGHRAVGLDACLSFVTMARAHSGCDVLHQDFLHLDLTPASFDGIFANASLFHVPRAALADVLADLHSALRDGGVLFSSNPRGRNEEGWSGHRYGCWQDLEGWRGCLAAAGFEEIEHYFRPPGRPREQQPWLAGTWRKVAMPSRPALSPPSTPPSQA